MLAAGDRFGGYEIHSRLGAGGMGEVYRARDLRLRRDVAIKVLPQNVALDHDRIARFEREAHLLAALNHPNIATLYGLEESNGATALVMELVEGQTLADLRGTSIPDTLALMRLVAEALDVAHQNGIIHRDAGSVRRVGLRAANLSVTDHAPPPVYYPTASCSKPSRSSDAEGGETPCLRLSDSE